MSALRFYFLGGSRVVHDERGVLPFKGRKALALLSYLALESKRLHAREALMGLFWSEMSQKDAQNNLRVTLARINKGLGDASSYLLSTKHSVQFRSDGNVWMDVLAFEDLLSACQAHDHEAIAVCGDCHEKLVKAAELYQGDVLADLYLSDSEVFTEWQLTQQERLRLKASSLFSDLLGIYEQKQDFEQAEYYARRLLKLEFFHEFAQRSLMRLLSFQGKRNQALSHFKAYQAQLQEDLGIEPEDATIRLFHQIQSGQLGAASLGETSVFAPKAPSNLPTSLTPFIGREEQLKQLREALESQRLITILGMGGLGKTRLALEFAESQRVSFKDGVYFLSLAPLEEPDLLASSLTEMFGLSPQQEQDARVTLLSFLKDKSMLLLLDNFEHLLEARSLVHDMIQAAPKVKLLITSRQKLSLSTEAVLKLKGLPYPVASGVEFNDKLLSYESTELFMDTAKRVKLEFSPKADDLASIADISQLVEGHPLALVLAASWLESLSCAEVAEELRQGIDLLETTWHDFPERHRSIEAAFRYSWQRLSQAERIILAELSIFRGGFNRKAAQAVAGVSVKQLSSLVNVSLIQFLPDRGRYDMHELMRQFVQRQSVSKEDDAVYDRYSHHYLELLQAQQDSLIGREPRKAAQTIQDDLDNVRSAWQWAKQQQNVKLLHTGLTGLARFYDLTGLYQEGLERFDAVLKQQLSQGLPKQHSLQLNFLLEAAHLACQQNTFDPALAYLAEAKQLALALADSYAECRAEGIKAEVAYFQGNHDEARELSERLLERVQAKGFRDLEALCLRLIAISQRDLEFELDYLKQAAQIYHELNNASLEQRTLINLSVVASEKHDYGQWKHFIEQAQQLSEYVVNKTNHSLILNLDGLLMTDTGHYQEAIKTYKRSQALCRETGNYVIESFVHHNLCFSYTVTGQVDLALQHGHEALRLAKDSQALHVKNYAHTHLAHAQLLAGHLNKAKEGFEAASEGWESLSNTALNLENIAGLADVAMKENNLPQALSYVNTIYEGIKEQSLDGADEPFRIYLSCYKILECHHDLRAKDLLERAHGELQEHAAMIDDADLKQSFLHNVPFNHALLEAWSQLQT